MLQLVAYGAQDVYLTGNPQITFWKVVYRRYTNFAIESIQQTFNGAADFGKRVTCTIARNGDLIYRVYLQVTLPDVVVPSSGYFKWVDHVGLALIDQIDIEIGGQRIDKHYGQWMYIWNELSQSASKKDGYDAMIGNTTDLTMFTFANGANMTMPGKTLYIPLEFWFCRNPGLALPLIALQYHEVRMNLQFANWSDVAVSYGIPIPQVSLADASLYVDYVFLDTDERRRFAQASHEYLIEQLQFTGAESIQGQVGAANSSKIKLNFNHPCKEIIFVVQKDQYTSVTTTHPQPEWFNFSDRSIFDNDVTYDAALGVNVPVAVAPTATVGTTTDWNYSASGIPTQNNPVSMLGLQLNGHDRFSQREGNYFSWVQPYQHHERVPITSPGINVYSFALSPEEHQPSGTLNMSRIDTAVLMLTLSSTYFTYGNTTCQVYVYATNYNVLRIMSGMGGLAYSN